MKDLTKRQHEVVLFIQDYITQHGYPPTIREIGGHFSISVKAAFDHVRALRRKGVLKTGESRSRAIEIIDESFAPKQEISAIPVLGNVAAGVPLLSEENFDGTITVPAERLKQGSRYFALKVKGDSMINAGILDGDTAVIRFYNVASDGDIIVARVQDDAVTLKRFYRENNRIRLQAENPDYPPIYTQEIQVLGILQMIIRDYV